MLFPGKKDPSRGKNPIAREKRTLILGIGNPIVCDDSAGIKVAERLKSKLKDRPDIEVDTTSLSGMGLIDIIVGYARVIAIDAIKTPGGKPGSIRRLTPSDFGSYHSGTIHSVSLMEALELGRSLGLDVPEDLVFIAIEAEDIITFSERCTPYVEEALPRAEETVLRELDKPRYSDDGIPF